MGNRGCPLPNKHLFDPSKVLHPNAITNYPLQTKHSDHGLRYVENDDYEYLFTNIPLFKTTGKKRELLYNVLILVNL